MSHLSSPYLAADDNKSAQFMQQACYGALTALAPTQIGFFVPMRFIDPELIGDALRAYNANISPDLHLLCN